MKVGLFPNSQKKGARQVGLNVKDFLSHKGIKVFVDDPDASSLECPRLSEIESQELDLAIIVGGDGTILRMMKEHPEFAAPVLGINLGSLGFMTDVPLTDLHPSLQDLVDGKYTIQNRFMIEGTIDGASYSAVNDISFHRGPIPSLIEFAVHIDGSFVNNFTADGLIIATPNGSTAYSLSAGGPIVHPSLGSILLTPICPHTISNRPILLPPEATIELQYMSEQGPVEAIVDGFSCHQVHSGDIFKVSRSSKSFKWVSLDRHNYYNTLRTKLGWKGRLKK